MDEPIKKDYIPSFMTFANKDIPTFVEVKGKEWIYYGEKNDFPYYLIDLYTQSAYHKAIIDGKVSYISGNGWGVKTDGLTIIQKAQAQKLLQQPFDLPNLDDATLRWTQDLELFNAVAILVTWTNDQKSGTLQFIDVANIRTNADESEFYYTKHWFNMGRDGVKRENQKVKESKDWKVYPKYDPNNRKGQQIYYYKAPHPDQAVYAIPVYQGATTWINIDIDLAKYFYHTVGNAFVATHLINFFNGEPTDEKARAIEAKMKEKWTSPTGSRMIINFAPNKDSAANVETLQMSDADKQYEAVRKYSEQAMFTGHRVTSGMLFGVYREGTLGGRSELQFAEEHFQNAYVTPRQNILESIINELASDFGIGVTFYLNKVKRVGYVLPDATIEQVLTFDEKRHMALEQLGIKPRILQKAVFASDKEEMLIEKFESISFDCSNSELLHESPVEAFDKESVLKAEHDFMVMHFASDLRANQLERSIIDLLTKDGTMQPDAIATVTKASLSDVKEALKRLVDRNILKSSAIDGSADSFEVLTKGSEILDEKPAKTNNIKVVYRYGLAPKFKGEDELIAGSRKFCTKLIGLSKGGKRWSSEDIFALDNGEEGQNAWVNHGGWYTKPNTDIHIPTCRHTWWRQLVQIND